MRSSSLICLLAVSVLAVGSVAGQGTKAGLPTTLQCEFSINPIGIEVQNPALSWNTRRGAKQTAYQIQAASAEELLGSNKPDLWDSGKIKSDQSNLVAYQGKPLLSGKRVWWRVQYWDQDGVESGWSEPTWWEMGLLKQEEFKGKWISAVDQPMPDVDRKKLDFKEIVFIKRQTYNANHYYTEFINSKWLPGGNICVLNIDDGTVREIVPELKDGVFERFDVSFDAKKIVFSWKKDALTGYRIYEVNVDGSGLRQLTFPPPEEEQLVKKYGLRNQYHHGTDDMQPCYLPDGGIAFISTRCQYSILCDGNDNFTTTVLYRMDANGANMEQLSHSSVSEAAPVVLPDGRLLYTRWEYVDKGATAVKCLWTMNPDGSGSSEVYGANILLPPTLIYGRPIPGKSSAYVVLGTPHFPQGPFGTVIKLDMTKPIRTREPMTYITPDVDLKENQHGHGWAFLNADGTWIQDREGKGRLFRDPYPLSENLFLVAHKPAGPTWWDPKAYGIYWLDAQGRTKLLYKDDNISCWTPYPLAARIVPPVKPRLINNLGEQGKAHCIVIDVYHGLEGVQRGDVKYIRILEQIPRPWAARRNNRDDVYDQQHVVITKDTHLGLKVQHGIVPVENDGSAYFEVPADANIFLQVLDEKFMAVQTERTFVNYKSGEIRSCIGCHETPENVVPMGKRPLATLRKPSKPAPQPGEAKAGRTLDYALDVQPVFDKHCISCHNEKDKKGGLSLSGEKTVLFNASYENLVPERRKLPRLDRGLLGLVIGENHPKIGNAEYLPPKSLGSHSSVLVAMLSRGWIKLSSTKDDERAQKLALVHKDVNLTPVELLKITNWVDTNCQYYGSYWGRRNIKYANSPDFRPTLDFEQARSMKAPDFNAGKTLNPSK